jgi:hypothetical protein
MPVGKPTLATDTVLLVHTPPRESLERVVVVPAHAIRLPVITAGSGLTVSTAVLEQPVPIV